MDGLVVALDSARANAGLSQRALAEASGISQPTLSRILSGARTPKMDEVIRLAAATGCTVPQLTGGAVAQRVQCAARATNGSTMESMRSRLLHFLELADYLDDQGIPEV